MGLRALCWTMGLVAVSLLAGGCPPMSDNGDVRIPASDADGSINNTVDNTVTPTVGGTATDSLAVRFPGCNEPLQADTWKTQVLQLVNEERLDRGLDPVRRDATLEAQAEQYCCEMIFYDFFAHDNPDTGTSLGDRAGEFGYQYWVIGENLAAGQPDPVSVMEDWMNSPGHRANILNPSFTELGVGVRSGGAYGIYWTQEFGRPLDDPPPPQ